MNLYAPAGSREARVLLRIAADAISAIWVVVALTIRLGLIEHEGWARHTLGNPHGLWPLQLLTFSFIHDNTPWSDSYWSLVMHLLWLWGMISIAAEWMNLTDLIRVYSVATIGTGLVRLLLARAFLFFEDKFPIVGVVFPSVALAFGACYGLVERWWRGRAPRSPA